MKSILKLALLLLLTYLVFIFVKKIFTKDSWDLMVCKTIMEDGVQCYDNSYVLKGYKTQVECMEKGIELAKREGFECGKNCRENKNLGGTICDIVCNKAGCQK